VIHIICTN